MICGTGEVMSDMWEGEVMSECGRGEVMSDMWEGYIHSD